MSQSIESVHSKISANALNLLLSDFENPSIVESIHLGGLPVRCKIKMIIQEYTHIAGSVTDGPKRRSRPPDKQRRGSAWLSLIVQALHC